MKYRWIILFVTAYWFNFVWEEWHSQFYLHFKGETITHLVLAYAALVDASIITLLSFVAHHFKITWQQFLVLVGGGVAFSLALEWRALAFNRWAYADSMIIIPFLQTGLTPTIQLAALGSMAYWIAFKFVK